MNKIIIITLVLMQFRCAENSISANKILCWIPTDKVNHDKSLHVKNTWGKRCNYLLFFSSNHDDVLPAIVLNTVPGWSYLWGKVRKAIHFIYTSYLDKAGWFLKADDDTYVIMENLRYFLKDYNASEPWYFGKRFKNEHHKGYMYGGAGYILSRDALRKLVEIGFDNKNCKRRPRLHEDLELGLCLEHAGVKFGNTTDDGGKDKFFALSIDRRTAPFTQENDTWMWEHMYYITTPGINGCSQTPISFHKVTPGYMYVFEYLLYHVNVLI